MNYLKIVIQYLIPQHLVSFLVGKLTHCRRPTIKNWMIKTFITRYNVNMSEAMETDPLRYPDFHTFFIRPLKPHLRPIAHETHTIVSPVDGCISQVGYIMANQLIQAKKFYFDLDKLLGDQNDLAKCFRDGNFCTFYLAPQDYHHVHMPLTGVLRKMVYIPGRLFSVNPLTTENVPQLFTRNERVICCFETAFGAMAVIFVGALLVGSISTTWAGTITSSPSNTIQTTVYSENAVTLQRGDNIGHFSLGSTVIVLFAEKMMAWSPHLQPDQIIRFGEPIGSLIKRKTYTITSRDTLYGTSATNA